jgi:hypothetical protein
MLSKVPEASEIKVPEDILPPKWKYWQEMSTDEYKTALQRIV